MRINHLAVIVAAVVYWIFGAIWYGVIFKSAWATLTGNPMGATASNAMVVSIVMAFVLSYTVGIALAGATNPQPARHGVEYGLFMGIGTFASQTLMDFLYEGRPIALWAIDSGYVVIGLALIGLIVGSWRKKVAA